MALDDAQLRDFRERGFVNAGRIFDEEQLALIGDEYDRLVHFDAQVLGNEEEGVYPYRAMLNFRSAPLRSFMKHPPLLEIAVQILGADVRFWWDQGINKAPGSGSRIEWHQDNGYQRGRTQEYLTCWLALDDSDLPVGAGSSPPEGQLSETPISAVAKTPLVLPTRVSIPCSLGRIPCSSP